MTTAAALVKPRTCPRCSGTGSRNTRVAHWGVPGLCFRCDGSGQVESDKARLAELKAEKAARAAYVAQVSALLVAARKASFETYNAALILEEQQPERFRKAVASFAAGREDVLPALVVWLHTEARPTR